MPPFVITVNLLCNGLKATGLTHTHHGHVDHHEHEADREVGPDHVDPHFVLYDYSMDDTPLSPLKASARSGARGGGGGGSGSTTGGSKDGGDTPARDALDQKLVSGIISQDEHDSIVKVMASAGRLSPL